MTWWMLCLVVAAGIVLAALLGLEWHALLSWLVGLIWLAGWIRGGSRLAGVHGAPAAPTAPAPAGPPAGGCHAGMTASRRLHCACARDSE